MTREEQIEQKAKELGQKYFPNENNIWARPNYEAQCVEFACKEMVEWANTHQSHWHDAQGDDLPEIDREVIVLRNNGQIAFGHRPNPDGEVWKHPDGTLEHVHFKTCDKGGWNIPNIKWWLDVAIPTEEGGVRNEQ